MLRLIGIDKISAVSAASCRGEKFLVFSIRIELVAHSFYGGNAIYA